PVSTSPLSLQSTLRDISLSSWCLPLYSSSRRPPTSTLSPTRRSSDLGPYRHLPYIRLISCFTEDDRCQQLQFLLMGSLQGSPALDRKSTRLNSSHVSTSYAVFCLKKKNRSGPPAPAPHSRGELRSGPT